MSLGLSQTKGLCQASNASTQGEKKYTINSSYSCFINSLIHIHSLLILKSNGVEQKGKRLQNPST